MENEFVLSKADYILKIIRSSSIICMSWGIESPKAIVFNNMAALAFKVNGFLYRGVVVVALNSGTDTFEIFTFLDFEKKEVKEHITAVYFDNLVSVIDSTVETENDKSAEYQSQVAYFLSNV